MLASAFTFHKDNNHEADFDLFSGERLSQSLHLDCNQNSNIVEGSDSMFASPDRKRRKIA